MSSARAPRRRTSQERLRQARAQIAKIEFICSGTLFHRTKMCGKPNCACATDPKARHGPYFEWSRRKETARCTRPSHLQWQRPLLVASAISATYAACCASGNKNRFE